MDDINLIELTDQFLERDRTITEERLPHFYPSEARQICEETGEVIGHCLRASYYRLIGIERTDPPNARAYYIFMLGNLVEAFLIERWKEMGIWEQDNVAFYDREYNVSGKIDCFIRSVFVKRDGVYRMRPRNQSPIIGVEVKSFYGYYATKEIMGNQSQDGRPKTNQLLQAFYYAERYSHRGIPGFKMAYLARDSVQRREFNVVPTVTSVGGEVQRTRPRVDGKIFGNISIEAIRESYRLLDQALRADTLPARDYIRAYDKATVEAKYAADGVSKSKYDAWTRARKPCDPNVRRMHKDSIGDWQCSYCNYQQHCWVDNDEAGEEITLDQI
ncbi:MAG: hypothetical protein KAR39_12495 [Thermoplasmata archaeon]|nr:hypothetical protein [Thermoplasmata archaeon]